MDMARAFLHLGVVLATAGPINPAQTQALKKETARIWRAYGVDVTWIDGGSDCNSDEQTWMLPVDRLLRVVADVGEEQGSTLGSVRFVEGIPGETIHLAYPPLSRLVLTTTIGMLRVNALSRPLQDRLVGQALGRVLAHELGHVLLALRSHEVAGLMRPSFTPFELVAPEWPTLRLSKRLASRLRAMESVNP